MNREEKQYSQWTAMLAISRASFRSITRSPSAVIFTIAFPLVFIIAFGFINPGRIKLEVGLHPGSDTSSAIYRSFILTPNVKLVKDQGLGLLESGLNKGRLDALLFIHPPDSTRVAGRVVEVITSKSSREKGRFVESILTNIIDKGNLAFLKARIHSEKYLEHEGGLTEFRETEIAGREYKMIDFILPGQLGFSILSAGVFGTAFVFFSLRQTLVLKRFFATPVKRPFIILGEALSRLVFQVIGAIIIILIGKFAFGFTLIHGVVTVLNMLILSAIGLIVFMGFGFVVSGIAKNESVIPPIANIVTLPQFLLSGTFFPVDVFPDWLQSISRALPLTYLNDALRQVAFEGAGLTDVLTPLLFILGWGVVVYALAVRFFRWE